MAPQDVQNEERNAQRHRLNMTLLSLDSDLKHKQREKDAIAVEIRQLEKKSEEIHALMNQKSEDLKRVEKDLAYINDEIAHARRSLNALAG